MAHEKRARGMWHRSSAGYGSAPRPAVVPELVEPSYGVCWCCGNGHHDRCLNMDRCECSCNAEAGDSQAQPPE
jgi:hypothetical protein